MVHHSKPETGQESGRFWASRPGFKPILILIAAVFIVGLIITPPPQGMVNLVSQIHPPGYKLGAGCNSIAETVNKKLRPEGPPLTEGEVAQMAKLMVGILLVALLIPVLMGVYEVSCKMYGVEKDKALAVFLLLGGSFAAPLLS